MCSFQFFIVVCVGVWEDGVSVRVCECMRKRGHMVDAYYKILRLWHRHESCEEKEAGVFPQRRRLNVCHSAAAMCTTARTRVHRTSRFRGVCTVESSVYTREHWGQMCRRLIMGYSELRLTAMDQHDLVVHCLNPPAPLAHRPRGGDGVYA